jgi:hypothetical protein
MAKKDALTYEQARKECKALQTQLWQVRDERNAIKEKLRAVGNELKAVVQREEFDKATQLKNERESLDTRSKELSDQEIVIAGQFAAMNTAASNFFFADFAYLVKAEDLVMTRVTVVNPENHDSVTAVYSDSANTVCLTLSGKHFESEAWHLGEWAVQHGFYTHYNEVKVSV